MNVMKDNLDIWNDTLRRNDAQSFWKHVDWKGNFQSKKQNISPAMNEFENFYEDLFTTDSDETEEIMGLASECYIPVLDDPITEEEIKCAWKDMKKAGYDYSLHIIRILVTHFSLMMVTILNLLFYVQYPVSLACSLLSTIPKKGNLKLPKNYRGIQMMKSIACLYDRIIANRLKLIT